MVHEVFFMNQAKLKERELILKLAMEKKTCRDIADILGTNKSKVSFWVNRYKKTGVLADKPKSGRPTLLTKKELDEIKTLLRAKLLEAKSGRSGFLTKEVLTLIEQKAKHKYTMRHAERIMHKIGLSQITPRVSHIRKDKKAQDKFRVEFKKNSNRNMWVFQ